MVASSTAFFSTRFHLCAKGSTRVVMFSALFVVLGFLVTGPGLCRAATPVGASTAELDSWVYDERLLFSPSRWGHVKDPSSGQPYFPFCDGTARLHSLQSPINIAGVSANPSLVPHTPRWVESPNSTFYNDGVEVLINVTDSHTTITDSGEEWLLTHISFLTPSGHTFGGAHFVGELHLHHTAVSSAEPDRRRVFVVLLEEGYAGNTHLAELIGLLPEAPRRTPSEDAGVWSVVRRLRATRVKSTMLISVNSLLPSSASYVTYEGSLAVPPCEETVTYIVFAQPVRVSTPALQALRRKTVPTGATTGARGPQPINGRKVSLFVSRRQTRGFSVPPGVAPLTTTSKLTVAALTVACLAAIASVLGFFVALLTTRV